MFNKATSVDGQRRDSFTHKVLNLVPDLRTQKQRFEDNRVFEESLAEGHREVEEFKRREEAKQRRGS